MKFICLVYNDEARLEALADYELAAMTHACLHCVRKLERSGRHVVSMRLQSRRTATTLRARGGRVSMSDGPFTETKEHLAGFTVFDARDLNDALRIASALPAARYGTVEVRPVLEPGAPLATALDRRIEALMRAEAVQR